MFPSWPPRWLHKALGLGLGVTQQRVGGAIDVPFDNRATNPPARDTQYESLID